jgi:hypothetical protein
MCYTHRPSFRPVLGVSVDLQPLLHKLSLGTIDENDRIFFKAYTDLEGKKADAEVEKAKARQLEAQRRRPEQGACFQLRRIVVRFTLYRAVL